MAVTSLCPDPQVLQRLLLGQVPPAEAAPLGEHLLHCVQCAGTLHSLKAEDTLVEALRAGAAVGEDPENAAIQSLIGRLEGLRTLKAVAPAAASDTVAAAPAAPPSPQGTVSLHAAPRAASSEEATEVVYDFLAPAQAPGELGRLGPYRVLKVLGAGGMGVVFQAEDTHLERMVALKAMLPALASNPSARQRFLREAKAAAAIEHDHIVPIFQVGEDRGAPFLAMPLLKGEPLDERLKRENKLPVSLVLRIGREIAEGLAAAHERGLIHRDVKPGNIWLEGQRARVKILDFGLARAVADSAHLTQSGVIVGTPAYMAPEQTRGGTVDCRADLFSLGCVLYRLATGELPFKGADTMSILASLALDNPPPPRERDANIPAELSGLVMQLLAKKPEDRPQTAQAVVERIRAIEQGQDDRTEVRKSTSPADVAVRPAEGTAPAPAGRTRAKPSGRRRILVAVSVALGALGVGGYLSAPTVYRIVTDQGELVIDTVDPDVEVTIKQGGQVITIIDPKTRQEITLKAGTYRVELPVATRDHLTLSADQFTMDRNGQVIVKVSLTRRDEPKSGLAEAVGEIRRFVGHTAAVESVALSPDGRYALSGSGGGDNTVRLWDVQSGRELWRFPHLSTVACVAFSPDSRHALSGSFDSSVRLWDVSTGKELHLFEGHTKPVFSAAFSPDGRRILTASGDQTVRLWEVDSGKELRRFEGIRAALSPDGRRALSVCPDKSLRLWDVDTGEELRRFEWTESGAYGMAYSPDGRSVVIGDDSPAAALLDLETGKEVRQFKHDGLVHGVAFSPDGRRVLSASMDKTMRLWDIKSRIELQCFRGYQDGVAAVAFSADGRLALSGGGLNIGNGVWSEGHDFALRLWRLPEPDRTDNPPAASVAVKPAPADVPKFIPVAGPVPLDALRREQIPAYELAMAGGGDPALAPAGLVAVLGDSRLKHWRGVSAVAFSPDGKTLASGSGDQTVKLWDPNTGRELRTLNVKDRVRCLAISPDGKTLAAAGEFENIKLWDPVSGKELQTLSGHHGQIFSVAFRGDGQMLACGAADGVVILWDAGAWKERAALTGHKGEVRSVVFSPDGKTLASGGEDGTVRLWDVDGGKEWRTLGEHQGGVFSVAYSPDGKTLATGGADGTVRLWDVDAGKERRILAGQKINAFSVAFSLDGKMLASADNVGTIRLWDLTVDKEPRVLTGHIHDALSVAFSPDGKTLASGGFDHTVRLWEIDTGKERFPSAGKTDWVSSVAFSPDGKVLASGCGDATAKLWDAATGKELHTLSGHQWWVSSVAFSPNGKMLATGSGDNTVKVWDRDSAKELFTLTGHKGEVRSVAFSPDGKTLASGSWDKTVKLWETDTGKELDARTEFQDNVHSVAFSPDGRLGAAGNGTTDCLIRLWQTATGRPMPFLKGHQGTVYSVAFRPDSRMLASASGDGTVRLWDPATGAEKVSYRLCPEGGWNGWQGLINQVAFSPDGRYLATANGNGTVYILRLAPAAPAGKADPTDQR